MTTTFGAWVLSNKTPLSPHLEELVLDLNMQAWVLPQAETPAQLAGALIQACRFQHSDEWRALRAAAKEWGQPLPTLLQAQTEGLPDGEACLTWRRHVDTEPDRSPVSAADLEWALRAVIKGKEVFPELAETEHCLGIDDATLAQVVRAKRWLSLVGKAHQPFTDRRVYSLKHTAERWQGEYVSTGALIAAAIALDIEVVAGVDLYGSFLCVDGADVLGLDCRTRWERLERCHAGRRGELVS